MTFYDDIDPGQHWFRQCSGVLLLDSTKLLLQPTWTDHKWATVSFTWVYFNGYGIYPWNDTAPSSRDERVHFCYMIYINGFRKRSCDLLSRLFEVASLTLCQSHDFVNTIEVILNAMCRIGRHQTTTTQLHAKRMRTFMCINFIAQVTRS